VDEDADDVEARAELLDAGGEELLDGSPLAMGGAEGADGRGVRREVSDEDTEPPDSDEGLGWAVDDLAELEVVEAGEVGLELFPAFV